MSGAPHDLYAGGEFIAVRREAVQALGSWEAAGVWHRICWRAQRTGTWVATIAQIAEECLLSEHKVKVALTAIREAGWITARRAAPADRTLEWAPVWATPSGESLPYLEGKSASTPSVETVETPPTPRGGGDGGLFPDPAPAPPKTKIVKTAEPEGFAEWYALYPRKQERQAAAKAYGKALRLVTHQQLMEGLRRQLPSLLATKAREPRYVKQPARWLNAGCWDDEVLPDNVHPIRADYDAVDPAAVAALPPAPRGEMYGW